MDLEIFNEIKLAHTIFADEFSKIKNRISKSEKKHLVHVYKSFSNVALAVKYSKDSLAYPDIEQVHNQVSERLKRVQFQDIENFEIFDEVRKKINEVLEIRNRVIDKLERFDKIGLDLDTQKDTEIEIEELGTAKKAKDLLEISNDIKLLNERAYQKERDKNWSKTRMVRGLETGVFEF